MKMRDMNLYGLRIDRNTFSPEAGEKEKILLTNSVMNEAL